MQDKLPEMFAVPVVIVESTTARTVLRNVATDRIPSVLALTLRATPLGFCDRRPTEVEVPPSRDNVDARITPIQCCSPAKVVSAIGVGRIADQPVGGLKVPV